MGITKPVHTIVLKLAFYLKNCLSRHLQLTFRVDTEVNTLDNQNEKL